MLAVGVFLAGLAGDYTVFVGAQMLTGIGCTTCHSSGISVISDLEAGTTEVIVEGVEFLPVE